MQICKIRLILISAYAPCLYPLSEHICWHGPLLVTFDFPHVCRVLFFYQLVKFIFAYFPLLRL